MLWLTTVTGSCLKCGECVPQCPTGAIKVIKQEYWIDPSLCNNCEGFHPEPQCVAFCPASLPPVPLQAKKGRCKTQVRPATSPDLFANGESSPFASTIAIWELCNILTQRQSLAWQTVPLSLDPQEESSRTEETLCYERQVSQGRGSLVFQVADGVQSDAPMLLNKQDATAAIQRFDIRAACLSLIYAAHATALERPWEQEFAIDDRQIETYLGLEKRKDLSKLAKLMLIEELVQQPCRIVADIQWTRQGKVKGFSLERSRLWHLIQVERHFEEDEIGCKHLVGLTFRIRAGAWAQYFLNQSGCRQRTAFYQYGVLPKSLLLTIMSIWQRREGAARIMLWLLFKTKMGGQQRITVPTLMRVAYGERKVAQATGYQEERKRLLRTFESDLETLHHYGLKPIFDPVTYPQEIQPLWAKLEDLPEDAEEALEFWANDGTEGRRLTDAAPRGKWSRLMNARLLSFEFPSDWQPNSVESKKKQRSGDRKKTPKASVPQNVLSGEEVAEARKKLQFSQRHLAELISKSQSWIRDVENGRFQAKGEDGALLRKVLGMK
ncbi:4Fe-4S binding protein [bacterium]|nr:4Fe-4S binding protein [bacterium]